MTRLRYLSAALVISAGVILSLCSCTTEEELRTQRVNLAVRHFDRAKYREVPENALTLQRCIELALEHNLDLKASRMEEQVGNRQKVAELLRMLPEINFNYTGTYRDRFAASGSAQVDDDGSSYGASTSQKKSINHFNLDFALSVMDFGLAFFNTQQAQDRALMLKQRNIRLAQNLVLDVTKVYFNVAVFQRAKMMSEELLKLCQNRADLIRTLAQKRAIDPFRAFEETRKFNDMERRLKYYTLQYENAAVELRSLLGYYATSDIKVDDSILDKAPDIKLPRMEIMEQIALLNRPEMMERDIQRHINVVECRKIILSMFPTVRFFLDYNASSNSFLYNQSWWDLGINSAINLMKLPMKIAQLTAQGKTVDAEDVKAYGQAITIMAQVRISHADININKKAFEQDDKTYTNYNESLLAAKKALRKASTQKTQLEVDHMQLQVVNAAIIRMISLSNYYQSYFRLMNAMGLDNLKQENFAAMEKELLKQEVAAEEEIRKAVR
ncbi:MAG: TolC family protein [Lentisphaeria bacterium]|nr:TolC family protein [Lentisphaeria bacterium]